MQKSWALSLVLQWKKKKMSLRGCDIFLWFLACLICSADRRMLYKTHCSLLWFQLVLWVWTSLSANPLISLCFSLRASNKEISIHPGSFLVPSSNEMLGFNKVSFTWPEVESWASVSGSRDRSLAFSPASNPSPLSLGIRKLYQNRSHLLLKWWKSTCVIYLGGHRKTL